MKQVLISAIIFLIICSSSIVHAEEIMLCAGSGPLDSVFNPVKDAFEKNTGIKITYLFGSASLTLKQLNNKVCEAASVGISFDDILEILKKEGNDVKNPEAFRHVLIGKSKIHIVVNKTNPVSRLSKEQLKGIFTGKISNWSQVGGNNTPIIVILPTLNTATITSFRKLFLDDEPYTKDILELGLANMTELRGAIEANSETIGFGSSTILGNDIKRIESPEAIRPIILITKGEPSTNVKKLIDFILTGPGKKLVQD